MIQVRQDRYSVKGAEQAILKNGYTVIDINTDLIKQDIDKLKQKLDACVSKYDKESIKNLIDYLEKFLRLLKKGKAELSWSINDYVLTSSPIRLLNIPEYSIDMTNYIMINQENLIEVQYQSLLDIISIELMYREFGETFKSMEEKLKDIGIISIVGSERITGLFDDRVYELSRSFKVSDSPYLSGDKSTIEEYFGRVGFKTQRYREPVDHSVLHALTIIFGELSSNIINIGIDYKIAAINTKGIYLLADNSEKIMEIVKEKVVVRAFGRQFVVNPDIRVY